MTGTGAEPGASSNPEPALELVSTPEAASPPATAAELPSGPLTAVAPSGQPPVIWPASPPPVRRNRGIVIAAVTVGVVLLVACLGLAGGVVVLRSTKTAASGPTSGAPLSPTTGNSPTASTELSESEPSAAQGPRASTYPATDIQDLDRVCDENVYYPQSPKRAGKPPHPVVLLVAKHSGLRHQNGTYYYDEGLSKRVEQTWAAEDPRNVQMVACLDRVSTGSTIRRCRYDDPKPLTVTLLRAGWRLRVYEVATGRKLLDKAMPGDDQACPYVVMVYADRKIYAEVSNRAVLAALRNLVKK